MFKTTIQIKTIFGEVLFEHKEYDNTVKKTLEKAISEGANLRATNLREADLERANLEDWMDTCSRDILFILQHRKAEVPHLRQALLDGKVDGSQYEGECACLVGTIANADGSVDEVCESIPYYDKGTHNPGEQFFWNIREGDTPENSWFAEHALKLCDEIKNDNQ